VVEPDLKGCWAVNAGWVGENAANVPFATPEPGEWELTVHITVNVHLAAYRASNREFAASPASPTQPRCGSIARSGPRLKTVLSYSRSTIIASPWPPATHIVSSPTW
jgi:hypothetical protein